MYLKAFPKEVLWKTRIGYNISACWGRVNILTEDMRSGMKWENPRMGSKFHFPVNNGDILSLNVTRETTIFPSPERSARCDREEQMEVPGGGDAGETFGGSPFGEIPPI